MCLCVCVSVCVTVCLLQSELIQAYKMMPQTSKEELIIFITVYQMDPVTEYTGEVEMHFDSLLNSHILKMFYVFLLYSNSVRWVTSLCLQYNISIVFVSMCFGLSCHLFRVKNLNVKYLFA